MNRKSRFGLKNKNTQMTVSLMLKFVLVLALFVMMAGNVTAGTIQPFLDGSPSTDNDGNLTSESITLLDNSTTVQVIDRSRQDDSNQKDFWNGTQGGYYGSDYTGYYLGTFNGNNESEGEILQLIQYFLDDPELSLLGFAKHDLPNEDGNNEDFEIDNDYYDLKVEITSLVSRPKSFEHIIGNSFSA